MRYFEVGVGILGLGVIIAVWALYWLVALWRDYQRCLDENIDT